MRVWLADLLHAAYGLLVPAPATPGVPLPELAVTEQENGIRQIARLFNIECEWRSSIQPLTENHAAQSAEETQAREVAPPPQPLRDVSSNANENVLPRRLRIRHRTGPSLRPAVPGWAGDAIPLEESPDAPVIYPDPPSLIEPRHSRAVLSEIVRVPWKDGLLDLNALLSRLTQGHEIESLPYLPRRAPAAHIQVLLDRSESMAPFYRDQEMLLDRLKTVLGGSMVREMRFVRNPLRGVGSGPRPTWARWKPPAPGTLVLLLTDLGIGPSNNFSQPASASDWATLAYSAHQRGVYLVALVPYPPHRWPLPMRQLFPIFTWDRTLKVQDVHRGTGRWQRDI